MDGGELAERALDLDPSLVVVLMVGPEEAETRELLSGYHDLPVLWKSLAPQELARRVQDFVGRVGRSRGYPLPAARRSRSRRRTSNRHEV
jgi:hypothetical protein